MSAAPGATTAFERACRETIRGSGVLLQALKPLVTYGSTE
jgi:hypothetical protein